MFVLPAVLVVLAMSIFPLIISLYFSLSRFRFVKGGFELKFVGLLNYKKLLLGSEQFHFLGDFGQLGASGLGRPRPRRPGADRAPGALRAKRGLRLSGVASALPDSRRRLVCHLC